MSGRGTRVGSSRQTRPTQPPPISQQPEKKNIEEEEELENFSSTIDAITLISNDGYQFVIEKRTAMISQTLRNILYGGGNYEEKNSKVIRLTKIRSQILEKIIEYWHYRTQYSDHIDQLPKFNIDPSIAIELLNAAEYLQT